MRRDDYYGSWGCSVMVAFTTLLIALPLTIGFAETKVDKEKTKDMAEKIVKELTISKADLEKSLKERKDTLDKVMENIKKLQDTIEQRKQQALLLQGSIQQLQLQLQALEPKEDTKEGTK